MNCLSVTSHLIHGSFRNLSTQIAPSVLKSTAWPLVRLRNIVEDFQNSNKLEGVSRAELAVLSRAFYAASIDREIAVSATNSPFYDDCRKVCVDLEEVIRKTEVVKERGEMLSTAVLGVMASAALSLSLPYVGVASGFAFTGVTVVTAVATHRAGSDLIRFSRERSESFESKKRSIDLELRKLGPLDPDEFESKVQDKD